MNIEEMTLKNLIDLAKAFGQSPKTEPETLFWVPGKKYFIRTVTHHHTGMLVQVGPQEIILQNAAWIADDGRFTGAVESGEFNEVEMFPVGKLVLIGRASIIDAVEISAIPISQK